MSNADIIKPMMAATIKDEFLHLNVPFYAQPKLDGIRAILKSGEALSRSMKPIPNKYIQSKFAELTNHIGGWGLDGELIIGNPVAEDVYNRTQSGVMSIQGEPEFSYYVFDIWNLGFATADERMMELDAIKSEMDLAEYPWVKFVSNWKAETLEKVLDLEQHFYNQGYEGIILRGIHTQYKYGRSTLRQGHLLKRKAWADMEATIVGFQELMSNQNEAQISERGYTVRSSKKEGLVAAETLGAFICECEFKGKKVTVSLGTGLGLDQKLRQQVWDNQEAYLGKLVKFKYLPIGSKDAPRHLIFLGFRDPIDLDPNS